MGQAKLWELAAFIVTTVNFRLTAPGLLIFEAEPMLPSGLASPGKGG